MDFAMSDLSDPALFSDLNESQLGDQKLLRDEDPEVCNCNACKLGLKYQTNNDINPKISEMPSPMSPTKLDNNLQELCPKEPPIGKFDHWPTKLRIIERRAVITTLCVKNLRNCIHSFLYRNLNPKWIRTGMNRYPANPNP